MSYENKNVMPPLIRRYYLEATPANKFNRPAAMFDAEMCSFSAVSKANLPADFV